MIENLQADGKCSKCGAAIAWVKTQKGKNCPLNPEVAPDGRGNFTIEDGIAVYVKDEQREENAPIFEAHFATCGKAPEPAAVPYKELPAGF